MMGYNDKLLLAEHEMTKGWAGSVHSHPHDHIVNVVRGHLKVICGDATFEVCRGDSFVVRGGVDHGATAIEDSLLVDAFTPCRQDYIS